MRIHGRTAAPVSRTCTRFWRCVVAALALGIALGSCDTTRSLRPANRRPVATSLSVFPNTIGPLDSAVVTCVATDADGDTLVYDWFSDCRLVGPRGEELVGGLYHRFSPSLVVHRGCDTVHDTAWVSCYVRDRRGGGAYGGQVRIILAN